MSRIAIVVGTRPEIIKMAPVHRACVARGLDAFFLHTGQHYSRELDAVFFEELELPAPRVNLASGSGTATAQLATILERVGTVLRREPPDWLLVEGDTNSVLAAALAANKCGVKLAHVEAGLRSRDRAMPEEVNRIVTDHLSDLLFSPTEAARANLLAEGIAPEQVHVTGNTVVDELERQLARARACDAPARHGVAPGGYVLATVHRAENTDDVARLRGIFDGLARVGEATGWPVLCAVHPRTAARLERAGLDPGAAVRVLGSLPYLEFLSLEAAAGLVMTDSGGLQEEACVLGVPCVTLRDNTERPESVTVGANQLAGADPDAILRVALAMRAAPRGWKQPFGDGHAGERIAALLG